MGPVGSCWILYIKRKSVLRIAHLYAILFLWPCCESRPILNLTSQAHVFCLKSRGPKFLKVYGEFDLPLLTLSFSQGISSMHVFFLKIEAGNSRIV